MPKKKIRINRICKICNTEFEIFPTNKKIYCSKKCANADIEVKQKIRQSLQNVWDNKYNGKHPMSLPEVQEKHNTAMLQKHGVRHALQKKELIEKSKQTKLIRYNNESYNNIDKSRQTKLEKYGNSNYNGHSKRAITKFETIINTWKHLTPLFTNTEFTGVSHNQIYKFSCNECGYTFSANLDNGYIPKCRNCSNNTHSFKSKAEYEIIEFIQSLNENLQIEHGNRKILNGKEIDIYIPKLNIGIELNRIYWHSESKISDKFHHLKKTKVASLSGISLLHIFDYQWYQKQEIVKSVIRNKLGYSEKIYARKCDIRIVKSKDKNIFLENTHIQGKANSSINIGLYYNNELVCISTFGKSRYDKKYDFELIRFSTKLNTAVIGGFSKILKHFIKTYKPKNILTYCDRMLSHGNVYYTNGFSLINVTKPNYFYFKNSSVFSRECFQKHKLKDVLKVYDESLTEYNNMLNNGFDRCWDCGNYKFVYNIS